MATKHSVSAKDNASDAANIKARGALINEINRVIEENQWTQVEAAKRCGAFQPRISHLLNCRRERFSLDSLFNIATRLGLKIDVVVSTPRRSTKKHIVNV
ncbi:MAG: helix-turn-helix domain-containing protein [Burkholderiales bacterium]|jgi:predicted XRE-type DNA-binding protein|nr:helix-turn-helix domain-containing protein [Burkholderiales bacterium]